MKRLLLALALSASLAGGAAASSAHHALADSAVTSSTPALANRPTIFMPIRGANPHRGHSSNLYYHGGTGGVGVETGVDKVYLV